MVDTKTREYIERTVKQYCSPDMIHVTLTGFENQATKAEGDKKIVCEAFVEGIKRALGKI